MNPVEKRAALATIIGNALLFVLKIIVGITFNAISLISDALNSLSDIIASTVVYVSIKVSHADADKNHQFGHSRSQPIAGFLVAIFTCLVGVEIFRSSVARLLSHETGIPSVLTIYTVCIVAFVKLILLGFTYHAYQKNHSVALKASMLDHRNDIYIAIIVFAGLFHLIRDICMQMQ
jgi:cation diffusion facilitator family transporter